MGLSQFKGEKNITKKWTFKEVKIFDVARV